MDVSCAAFWPVGSRLGEEEEEQELVGGRAGPNIYCSSVHDVSQVSLRWPPGSMLGFLLLLFLIIYFFFFFLEFSAIACLAPFAGKEKAANKEINKGEEIN